MKAIESIYKMPIHVYNSESFSPTSISVELDKSYRVNSGFGFVEIKSIGKSIKYRRSTGQGLVEIVAALAILLPVILVLIDAIFVFIGAGLNDTICRNAARAAASGPPASYTLEADRAVSSAEGPYKRALTVVKDTQPTNMPMKVRDTLVVRETVLYAPLLVDGGAIEGEISVETTIDIHPPCLLGSILSSGGISLKSNHTMPITYVLPPSTVESP